MTEEDKQLLLKDLCARLPYGIKAQVKYPINANGEYIITTKEITSVNCGLDIVQAENIDIIVGYYIFEVKPYLFPLSSMTEEQKRELLELTGYEARCEESGGFDSWGFYVNIVGEYKYEDNQESIILYPDDIGIDWCNKNHFDYRGLIPKGLAIDATGLNIYE